MGTSTLVTLTRLEPGPTRALPRMVWPPVLTVAGSLVGLLLVLSGRYGYHRDELYFRLLADQPAWGYVDQPPLTPLLARGAIDLLGDGVWALRVPAALLCGLLAVLLALLAREVGGGRRAQVVASLGAAGAGPLIGGHILLTASLDWPLWVGIGLLVVRALRRGDPGWWLAAGALSGLALYNKHLVLLLLLCLAAGLLIAGPRQVLRTPWPWAAAGLAVLVGAPNLAYQLANGLPQLQMAGSLTGEAARWIFLPGQLLVMGPPGALVWGAALWAMWRDPRWADLRSLGVAYVLACVLLFAVAGQFYYSTGFLLVLWAFGAVVVEQWLARAPDEATHRLRRVRVDRLLGINVLTSALVALPLLPLPLLAVSPVPLLNPAVGDQVGWQPYVQQVADVYDDLPALDRQDAILIAENYGEAGALDRYGPALGLPPVYSGHNALHDSGPPPQDARVAVVLVQGQGQGVSHDLLASSFQSCLVAGVLDNGVGVPNEEQGTEVMVCERPTAPWAQLWPEFSYVGLSTFCHPCRRLGV